MTMYAHLVLATDEKPSRWRWTLAAAVVVLVHAGLFYWLSRRIEAPNLGGAPESAILIELPPMGVAQPAPAAEVPPGPEMKEAEPEPTPEAQPEAAEPPPAPPVPDLAPAPKADAVLVAPEKPESKPNVAPKPKVEARPKVEAKPKKKIREEHPKPEAKREPGRHATRTTAPARQSAGAPGQASQGAAGSAMSASAWRSLVSAQLNRNKRYPPSAQGASGAAAISFAIDRSGRLVSASLVRSSGSLALDSEAVAIAHRASPFPPPPPEVPGSRITLTVPVNFRQQ